ncbi:MULTISPECIES: hypothetical protein [unclassified Bradyrhizobium]|uniref:hypothetical protein n=1 Tax=unclassified Bradyrhizobium TaxID=2631580 RepID=UPI001FF84384|nr:MULTISPECIES: hypothetical protein [unclassified Bradyrhizobium]MCK1289287.1 hypothetical protein [Bradyrhizobium sp. 30]MCK1310047.1 hypothetical protein [Bradyrhizobium sp. 45]MCK1332544.1 hypothetical protein [Bradyrhizobium sp. CW9]MCK1343135.1 hypothetical protein [Bradyrhizobium sp. CW11]MCK1349642.1 hypothetical protein [Bradyrhizobium sp. CW7]
MSKIGYNALKVTGIGKLASLLPVGRKGASLEIYAPSLRSLPKGSILVMATLPIIDWNDCLLRGLQNVSEITRAHTYAAIMMIDPFACWEDVAEALKKAGVSGVVNFPPASMIERSAAGEPVDSGQELELRRMEWFASLGFKILFAAADDAAMISAERRLGPHLHGIVYLPETALALRICDEMELARLDQQGSSIPKFALLDVTASRRPLGKNKRATATPRSSAP